MPSVFNRLGFDFDTNRFGSASSISTGAQNTLSLISNTSPQFKQWQIDDLSAGAIDRTNYFKNPTALNCASILVNTANIISSANLISLQTMMDAGNALVLVVNSFKSHTDNISGVVTVTSPGVPSYDTASGLGQQNMMTLTRTDGTQSNTTPILGSFTSLFIPDILKANDAQILSYSVELAGSITVTTGTDGNGDPTVTYSSNLSPAELAAIESYLNSTGTIMTTRRNHDFTFYQNSLQVTKDAGFLQQFNSMGGTNTYLVENVIGTDSLKAKLASANTA